MGNVKNESKKKRKREPSFIIAEKDADEEKEKTKKVQKNAKKRLTRARMSFIINLVLENSLRSVAQLGSARALGAWGRGFKSLHSDHFLQAKPFMAPWSRGQDTALSRR